MGEQTATGAGELRRKILSDPEAVLDDHEVMQALVAANERAMGGNIVDLRGVAMARLESRLDRLEETHRSVIAAAYDNLAGTGQTHRAVLSLLDAPDFPAFLAALEGDVAASLRVDCARLVLESAGRDAPELTALGDALVLVEDGFVATYLDMRGAGAGRRVALRQVEVENARLFGAAGSWIRSEAAVALDLGAERRPGLLVLGSDDPHHFAPGQGTELLDFFGGVVERVLRRFLG